MEAFHQWFYGPLAGEQWGWLLVGVRYITVTSICILLYNVWDIYRKEGRLGYWILIVPNVLLIFYYLDQLFLRPVMSVTSPWIVFFNVCVAMSYFGAFTVFGQLRKVIPPAD